MHLFFGCAALAQTYMLPPGHINHSPVQFAITGDAKEAFLEAIHMATILLKHVDWKLAQFCYEHNIDEALAAEPLWLYGRMGYSTRQVLLEAGYLHEGLLIQDQFPPPVPYGATGRGNAAGNSNHSDIIAVVTAADEGRSFEESQSQFAEDIVDYSAAAHFATDLECQLQIAAHVAEWLLHGNEND